MTQISVAYLDVSTACEPGPPEYATVESTGVNQAGIPGNAWANPERLVGTRGWVAKGITPPASGHA